MSNVLDLLDQTMFDVGRATGGTSLLQCVWTYDRPVDADGLQRFHDQLERGRLSRCVEESPLPFGRHRWVAPECSSDMEVVASPRPRDTFDRWLDEQSNTALDITHGPAWHLATIPFTDGGAGVSLVISHCLADGIGLWEAVRDAALGRDDPVSWPAAASRRWLQAVRQDALQTARDVPAIGRAVVSAVRLARPKRDGAEPATPPTPAAPKSSTESGESYTLPTATIFVDADEWDAHAQSLGGTRNTLLVGLAARLAQRAGRAAADGSVVVMQPVNKRTEGDMRANAISGVGVSVDPASATTNLREIRAAVKEALIRHRDEPDSDQVLNALVPLLPKRALKAARGATVGPPFNLVGSSNVGVIDPAAGRADGTDADSFALRLHHRGVTRTKIDRYGGIQTLLSGTVYGRVFISLVSYLPGRSNTTDDLHQDLSDALKDFSLSGLHL